MSQTQMVKAPDTRKYLPLIEDSLAKLLPHISDSRTGGYFTLADATGQPLLVVFVGEVEMERMVRYLRNSLEKGMRTGVTGDSSSRVTRNEARERWIGAIAGDNVIGSFSGLPENFDEILVTDVLVRAGHISPKDALEALEENDDFQELKHLFDWAS